MKDTRPTRPDYRTAYAGFSLAALEEELAGDLSEGINVCIEACDRHDGDAVALYWENERGDRGPSPSASCANARRGLRTS